MKCRKAYTFQVLLLAKCSTRLKSYTVERNSWRTACSKPEQTGQSLFQIFTRFATNSENLLNSTKQSAPSHKTGRVHHSMSTNWVSEEEEEFLHRQMMEADMKIFSVRRKYGLPNLIDACHTWHLWDYCESSLRIGTVEAQTHHI